MSGEKAGTEDLKKLSEGLTQQDDISVLLKKRIDNKIKEYRTDLESEVADQTEPEITDPTEPDFKGIEDSIFLSKQKRRGRAPRPKFITDMADHDESGLDNAAFDSELLPNSYTQGRDEAPSAAAAIPSTSSTERRPRRYPDLGSTSNVPLKSAGPVPGDYPQSSFLDPANMPPPPAPPLPPESKDSGKAPDRKEPAMDMVIYVDKNDLEKMRNLEDGTHYSDDQFRIYTSDQLVKEVTRRPNLWFHLLSGVVTCEKKYFKEKMDASKALRASREECAAWKVDINAAEDEANELRSELEDVKKQLSEAEQNDPAHVQQLTNEVKRLKEDIQGADEDIDKFQSTVTDLANQLQQQKKETDDLRAQLAQAQVTSEPERRARRTPVLPGNQAPPVPSGPTGGLPRGTGQQQVRGITPGVSVRGSHTSNKKWSDPEEFSGKDTTTEEYEIWKSKMQAKIRHDYDEDAPVHEIIDYIHTRTVSRAWYNISLQNNVGGYSSVEELWAQFDEDFGDPDAAIKAEAQLSVLVQNQTSFSDFSMEYRLLCQKAGKAPATDESEDDEGAPAAKPGKPAKSHKVDEKEKPKDFAKFSTSAPRRLNDIAEAPPELKKLPRGAKASKTADIGVKGSSSLREGVLSMAQKAMLEQERERAIRAYRELKKRGAAGV